MSTNGTENPCAKIGICSMLMPMIKAVFLDFDYTIYSHRTKKIPQSTLDAIKILKSKGIKVILATGRNIEELELFPIYKTIGFDGYILLNGQICLDENFNTICSFPFTGVALDGLVNLFNEKKQPIVFIEKDRIYVNYNSPEIAKANGEILCLRHEESQYTGNPIYLAVAYITKEDEPELLKRLPGCAFKRWGDFGIDIVNEGVDKAEGIKTFMKILNIDRSQTLAAGDSDNDCLMLEYAGTSFAMGNGTALAKASADFVTTDIDSDGLALAFQKLNLI